jgi:hypothetical protein
MRKAMTWAPPIREIIAITLIIACPGQPYFGFSIIDDNGGL